MPIAAYFEWKKRIIFFRSLYHAVNRDRGSDCLQRKGFIADYSRSALIPEFPISPVPYALRFRLINANPATSFANDVARSRFCSHPSSLRSLRASHLSSSSSFWPKRILQPHQQPSPQRRRDRSHLTDLEAKRGWR